MEMWAIGILGSMVVMMASGWAIEMNKKVSRLTDEVSKLRTAVVLLCEKNGISVDSLA